jgi:hypothetical protein
MRRNWVLIAALGAVLAVAAALVLIPVIFKPKVLVTLSVPLSYPGFQVWPTPRTFDQPGTLFVLNGDRVIHGESRLVETADGQAFLHVLNAEDGVALVNIPKGAVGNLPT